jgi:hypothetical protein
MAVLYVALGIILGGLSGVIMMAMFFVAKSAEEGEDIPWRKSPGDTIKLM